MGRPRLESAIKMQDARTLEALVVSNQKACNRIVKNNQDIEKLLFRMATNKDARQAFLRSRRTGAKKN